MYDLVISGGKVVMPENTKVVDIAINGEKIVGIGENLKIYGQKIIDAEGLYVLPGMIDAHVHINEPGRSDWEDYNTGTNALAKGGTTSMIVMPLNALPARTTKKEFEHQKNLAAKSSHIDFALYGGLVPDNQFEIKGMIDSGAVAFKAFMATTGDINEPYDFRNIDDYDLLKGMETIAQLNGILSLHAENSVLTDRLAEEKIASNQISIQDYVDSRPSYTEVEAVKRALYFGEITGCKLHFVHISTPEALIEIHNAKSKGQNVSVESCTHYFALTSEDFKQIGAQAKCSPPLRSQANQDKLFQFLTENKIDFITSDHSPAPLEMKQKDNIFEAWGGISGAQNNLDLTFDLFVKQHDIPLSQFAQMIASAPAARFGLKDKGKIAIGYDADFALLDPNQSYVLSIDDLEYKNKHSAYVGREIGATVIKTILRGKVIYTKEGGLVSTAQGKFLY